MSTYAELATEVLGMLDQPLTTTGDVLTQVQTKLHRINRNIIAELRPDSMLIEVSVAGVTSSATYLNLGATSPGFSVTDLAQFFQLSVDDNTSSDRNDFAWEFREWTTWLRYRSALDGNRRQDNLNIWTYDSVNSKFYLGQWPQSTDTWDVYLNYYKNVAVYADGTTPEVPEDHHGVIVYGTALEFPQYFQGDRNSLIPLLSRKYADAYNALFRDTMIVGKTMVQGAAPALKRSRGRFVWAA